MNPLTQDIKNKIAIYRKNRIDISKLIKNVNLKDADLSECIIRELHRVDDDISNCNFTNCVFGNPEGGISNKISLNNCNISGCSFYRAKFVSNSWIRHCKAHNCNFKNADVSLVDYQYSDFGDSTTFCNAKITISTNSGVGAIFPKSMFQELCKGWKTQVEVKNI
jgi:uncharacterized protein YjbI with pentapeptide repeats